MTNLLLNKNQLEQFLMSQCESYVKEAIVDSVYKLSEKPGTIGNAKLSDTLGQVREALFNKESSRVRWLQSLS